MGQPSRRRRRRQRPGVPPTCSTRPRRSGATVLELRLNRGKGHALKTGFAFSREHRPGPDVVCADSDGQHRCADILRVAGARRGRRRPWCSADATFTGHVPLRSRFGNTVTGVLFRLATGLPVHDTQTGLRGYPASMLALAAGRRGRAVRVRARTCCCERDAGRRRRRGGGDRDRLPRPATRRRTSGPLADSARIYAPLLRFSLSSFAAFLVDTVALLALFAADRVPARRRCWRARA